MAFGAHTFHKGLTNLVKKLSVNKTQNSMSRNKEYRNIEGK